MSPLEPTVKTEAYPHYGTPDSVRIAVEDGTDNMVLELPLGTAMVLKDQLEAIYQRYHLWP